MKKLCYLVSLVFVVSLVTTSPVEADAWYKRRRCNAIYERYKTKAQTWVNSLFRLYSAERIDKDKGCDKAESEVFWAYRDYTRAYAEVGNLVKVDGPFRIEYNSPGSARAIVEPSSPDYRNRAGYAPFHKPSIYSHAPIVDPHVSNKKGPSADVHIKSTADHEYDYVNHRIIIHGTEGHLMVHPDDIANEYTAVTVSLTYEPESYTESDDPAKEEEEYNRNVFWSSRAILNNGLLQMEGFFQPNNFQTVSNDGVGNEIKVTFQVDKMVVDVPKEYDLDDISVNFGVDAGNLGWGISEKFAIRKAKNELLIHEAFIPNTTLDFHFYPNPTADQLKIDATIPYSDDVKISLYTIEGNFIKELYQGPMIADQPLHLQESVLSLLPHRMYLVEIRTSRDMIVRKLIRE